MTPRRIRWVLGLASAAAFTWGSLLLLGANPLGFVLLASIPLLLALAHRPTKDRALSIAGVASGPILTALIYVLGRYLDSDALLSPTSVLREAIVAFPIPVAFSMSWAFLAWRAPKGHRWVRRSYQWWPAPVCAWGLASMDYLRYFLFEAHIFDFPVSAKFDILWLGVWVSIVGLIAVALPLALVAARIRGRGAGPAGLLVACAVVLLVAVDWVFHLSILSRIWLLDR